MVDSSSVHTPVLSQQVIEALAPAPGRVLVDGTLGGGGHARLLARRVEPGGYVIALDRDPDAIARAEREMRGWAIRVAQANYCDLPEVLESAGVQRVDGILLDLGLSSDQLADERRGFSFDAEGPLDLRFNPQRGEPAWRLLQRLSAEHLADLIYHWGEERYSRRVARQVVQQRRTRPVHTARELAELVRRCVPRSKHHRIDPATRTFQALRIAVNDELKSLEIALRRLPDCLSEGGKLAIISFHSLEDRRVKEAYRQDARLEVLTRKPIRADTEEAIRNPRSSSARLRVARRVPCT
jgi:16S rRNA (cytosine1402-N4)-methyltransferase